MPRERFEFVVLDQAIEIEADRPDYLTIFDAFAGAYMSLPRPRELQPIRVAIVTVRSLPPSEGEVVPIHRSKHRHWTFEGRRTGDRRHHVWTSRGVALSRDCFGRAWTISVEEKADPIIASEAAFHAVRSVALYGRPRGTMLHASAIAREANVIGFCGPSMAGKTTLLTACVRRLGWQPFTNDRLFVGDDPALRALSWPSYASYCEGALSADPSLAAGARAYERDEFPYVTQRWGETLRPLFDKMSKRIYPMLWQRRFLGQPFAGEGRLRLLLFPKIVAAGDVFACDELDLDDRRDRETLCDLVRENSFETHEPSFLPWHGLPRRHPSVAIDDLVTRMRNARVPVARLSAPVAQIGAVPDLVMRLYDRLPEYCHVE
jgi:hypothetical protein